jgi:hypothetical protein
VPVLLLCLAGLLGCATAPDDPFARGVWPLYTADARPWAGTREARALATLAAFYERDRERGFALRPWLSFRETREVDRWDVLFPLAARERTGEQDESWLFLLGHRKTRADSPRYESHLGIGFRGRTEGGETYGGVFPFYGRFRERLGFDTIRFALFPLFARGERGDYRETHVLWPLFSFGRGDGRALLRVWPLFGFDRAEGRYDRSFWLWPFVHVRREHLSSPRPERVFWVLPLYGRRDVGSWQTRFFLFPLWIRQRDVARPGVGSLDLLWPIWSSSRDREGNEFHALRPLFARRETNDSLRETWLLGLFGRTRVQAPDLEERIWQLLWAGRVGFRREAGLERRHADLWPLLRAGASVDAEGTERAFLRVPYLLPMRGLEPDGWQRHWNALFEIYTRRAEGDERRSDLFFGLLETRESPDAFWASLGGILHLRLGARGDGGG